MTEDGGKGGIVAEAKAGERANAPQIVPGTDVLLFSSLMANDDSEAVQVVSQSLKTGDPHCRDCLAPTMLPARAESADFFRE